MEHPDIAGQDSDGSASLDEFPPQYPLRANSSFGEAFDGQVQTPATTITSSPPSHSSSLSSWSSNPTTRPRGSSIGASAVLEKPDGHAMTGELRPQRPSAPARTPSNTYAPQRRPPQYISLQNDHQRSSSTKRGTRRDPNAQYRAQEKAYVQRIRANPQAWYHHFDDAQANMMVADADLEDPSPSSEAAFDDDSYDPDTQLFLPDDNLPTVEELRNPKNQERLEWHSMLASVLKGDVVKQEKQRLSGSPESNRSAVLSHALWIGVKARTCGRSIALQRKLIDDSRAQLAPLIEEIINFQIKGETEIGKPPRQQVEDVVEKVERCEMLYSTRKEMEIANPRTASEEFFSSHEAIFAWHNITALINTELAVLQSWVGNDALDFSEPRVNSAKSDISDDSSFLDRIMKEDGLKTLQGDRSMLNGLGEVIQKAKSTLIDNAEAFATRHLPPYIEELLTLINFPSRLIQEIIRVRLSYAKNMKDPAHQSPILLDQMISQFQILMRVAVEIKQRYLAISRPEPGWDLPPCVDENFDSVVLDAMKYYFRLLNWKLNANKNTFKEAEILEQEWEYSYEIGRQLESGDIEVAEQFRYVIISLLAKTVNSDKNASALTAKSLQRLMIHFERELVPRPNETVADMDKRYKSILDSTRIRQRKLYRFSRFLRQLFENATEYNITADIAYEFFEALLVSDHFLVTSPASVGQRGVYLIAHHSLWNRPADIQAILATSFREDDIDNSKDGSHVPYVLVIRPEKPLAWAGKEMQIEILEQPTDVRLGKLRLVVEGMQERLQNARRELAHLTGIQLDMSIEQRANLGRVNVELNKIKKISFKLSMAIMDSVAVIKNQLRKKTWEDNDLIQACYAFATEFGKRSSNYVDANRRAMNSARLVELSLDWVSFICDECDAADRKTFKWAVAALEFAMAITSSRHLLSMDEEQFGRLRLKVAGCMSLLISHFDIMGARSTLAAQAEKQRIEERAGARKLGAGRILSDEEASKLVRDTWHARVIEIEDKRVEEDAKRQALGRVLEGSNEADRSLTVLSSSATNVSLRWQQGQFIGGGTFGSVYVAINLDSNYLMAVKEIRLQDPQLIPKIAQQIRDEMGVLEVLDHPNIVSYHGIEVHRDKVYLFMEYCSGGSLASLLEHGRIEDETVIMVYALQLLEGLAYLHQAGIVHRDIKPENILLDHNGIIKYVDFGAAKIIARSGRTVAPTDGPAGAGYKESILGKDPQMANQRKNQKTTTGTPMYMSPEVIRGDSPNLVNRQGAVDIWSLGCVILEMATGHRPWSSLDNEWAIMYNIAQGNQPSLPTRDQLSDIGIDFLRRCFECDPLRRPTAAELLQHEWIVSIRQQVVLEPATPGSEYSSSSGSTTRQNSAYL